MGDTVTVPNIDEMDDETFLKHMDARHSHEVLNGPLTDHPDRASEWINPYRAFHDMTHSIAVRSAYDHEHLW